MGLGSLFQARDMKLQIKYIFQPQSFVQKLFCPSLIFQKNPIFELNSEVECLSLKRKKANFEISMKNFID